VADHPLLLLEDLSWGREGGRERCRFFRVIGVTGVFPARWHLDRENFCAGVRFLFYFFLVRPWLRYGSERYISMRLTWCVRGG